MIAGTDTFGIYFVTLGDPSGDVGVPPDHEVEDRHLDYLDSLNRYGALLSCGLFETADRGFMILRAGSRREAEETTRRDPLVESGYYRSVKVERLLSPNCEHR